MASEPNHHDMANTLKEMLKINSASNVPVVQPNHVGSGDGLDVNSNSDELQRRGSVENDVIPDRNPVQVVHDAEQTISMREVRDGELAALSAMKVTIVSDVNAEIDSSVPASNKIKINTITKFDWEHKYYPGSLISVTHAFIAYTIKGHPSYSVRVINRHNSSDRVLLKGFEGVVCDVAFASPNSNILAAIDSSGNVIIWQLDEIAGNISAEKKLHILAENKDHRESGTHRVSWIPCVNTDSADNSVSEGGYSDKMEGGEHEIQKILVVSYCNVAEVWDLDNAFENAKANPEVRRSAMQHVFVTVDGHEDDICDCELSPLGNVLAVASYDGYVKFWQIQFEDTEPPSCLHLWQPHEGRPVSAVKFCDNKRRSELGVYWRFLLTGCDRNSELKMWCSVTWDCLQVIKFQPPSPAHALPELNIVLYVTVDYIALTDVNRKVLYIMRCKMDIEEGKASVISVTPFQLAQPLLSVAFIDALPCKFRETGDGLAAVNSATKSTHGLFEANNVTEDEDDEEEDDDSNDNDFKPLARSPFEGSAKKVEGVLIKLIGIQPKSLQSLDVQLRTQYLESISTAASQDTLNTYNSISEDIKDDVSLGSGDVIDAPLDGGKVVAGACGGDDVVVSVDADPSQGDRKQAGDSDNAPRKTPSPARDHPPSQPMLAHSSTSDNIIAPDVTQSVVTATPVLLTPDAFVTYSKSASGIDSANSSFTAVTPFTNKEDRLQANEDEPVVIDLSGDMNQLSDIVLSPSTNQDPAHPVAQQPADDDPATPPSSPALPSGSSSPPKADLQQSLRVIPVKSPDLISSTSTLDGEGHKPLEVNEAPSSMPPVISSAHSNILGRTYAVSGPPPLSSSSDVFPPVLVPATSSSLPSVTSWPKAPDVTMSRSIGASFSRSSPPPSLPQQSASPPQVGQPPISAPRDTTDRSSSERHILDSQELIRVLTELQNQQRDLMNGHQRELQTMHKKQTQVQKQNDSSMKRTEQQGDRLERALKTVAENQRRILNDLRGVQSGVSDNVVGKMERIMKGEMKRTVLPGLVQSLEPTKEQMSQSVVDKLTATDAVMKDNIAKLIKSKETVDTIATATAKAIQSQVMASLPEIFFTTVIPSFERSTQVMFQQLSAAYLSGMEETVVKVEKQLQYRLKPDQDKLQGLIKEANDAAGQVNAASKRFVSDVNNVLHKQIPAEVEKALAKCEERISAKIQDVVRKQQEAVIVQQQAAIGDLVKEVVCKALDEKLAQFSSGESGRLAVGGSGVGGHLVSRPQSRPSILDQQQQILKHLQQGNVNTAFQAALTASDLSLVMYVCETVDPAVVFGVTPCPLQQPILLSLIQQLSSDLSTKTEIKLKYLQEAVMNLDRRHQVTQEYMHSVLNALVQKLLACAQGPLENSSLGKDLKMLAMAAQSLMK